MLWIQRFDVGVGNKCKFCNTEKMQDTQECKFICENTPDFIKNEYISIIEYLKYMTGHLGFTKS